MTKRNRNHWFRAVAWSRSADYEQRAKSFFFPRHFAIFRFTCRKWRRWNAGAGVDRHRGLPRHLLVHTFCPSHERARKKSGYLLIPFSARRSPAGSFRPWIIAPVRTSSGRRAGSISCLFLAAGMPGYDFENPRNLSDGNEPGELAAINPWTGSQFWVSKVGSKLMYLESDHAAVMVM